MSEKLSQPIIKHQLKVHVPKNAVQFAGDWLDREGTKSKEIGCKFCALGVQSTLSVDLACLVKLLQKSST